jgi:C-terminal processing protease CtpA/Prc
MENDVSGGTVAVDSNSNTEVTEGPMLYVIVGATIVGVALLTSILVYIVHQHRKQKQHRMNHEYMSTVGNGPASSRNSMREVVENEVALEDLELRDDDGGVDGDGTRIAAAAAAMSGTAVASSSEGASQRRKSLKRSRTTAKSYNNGRRVNDSSLTPIPENPLSPHSSVSSSSPTVVLNILAPPGKLGVIVDTPPQGGCAYVVEIRSSCPIREEIQLDDRIIAVDDKDVQRMSATSICKLLERKSRNAQRKITVLRRESNNNNIHGIAGNNEHNGSLHLPNSPMGRKDSNSDHAQASSLADSNTVQELNVTREIRIEIVAPPGRLGVVLLSPDPPETGPSYISSISVDSPLKGETLMGDKIIAVDDEDVRNMSAMNLSQLLGSKSTNPARKIVVLRQIAANAAAVCGADRGENDRSSSSASSTTRVTIVAPAGKLGVVVASNPGSGLAYVSEIKDSCPIRDEIKVGDQILEVDGEDVSKMKAIHISSEYRHPSTILLRCYCCIRVSYIILVCVLDCHRRPSFSFSVDWKQKQKFREADNSFT